MCIKGKKQERMNTNRRLMKAVKRAIQHSASLLDLLEIAMVIDPQIEWVIELFNEDESFLFTMLIKTNIIQNNHFSYSSLFYKMNE